MNATANVAQKRAYAAIGIAVVAVFAIYLALGSSSAEFLPRFAGVAMVVVGGYYLGRKEIAEYDNAAGGAQNSVRWMIVGAVALSAVSFSTTMFGMAEFVSNQSGNAGATLVAWFISLGTTFGIQILMFYIAMTLGRQLVNARNNVAAVHTGSRLKGRNLFHFSAPQLWALIGAMILTALAALAMFPGLKTDLYSFGTGLAGLFSGTNDGESRVALSLVLLALAMLILLGFGVFSLTWGRVFALVLLLVYLMTLTFSVLFSFDSYYRLLQDPEDAALRRVVIVEERTKDMLSSAQVSLQRASLELQNQSEAATSLREIQAVLDQMQARQSEVGKLLIDQQKQSLSLVDQRRANLQRALNAAATAFEEEKKRILQAVGDSGLAQERAATDQALREEADNLTSLQQQKARALALERRLIDLGTLIKCENEGTFLQFDICQREGSGFKNSAAQAADPCGVPVRGGKSKTCLFIEEQSARTSERQTLPSIADMDQAISTVQGQMETLQQRLETIDAQITEQDDNRSARYREQLDAATERYNSEIAALRTRFAAPEAGNPSGGAVSLAGLFVRLDALRRTPTTASLESWVNECTQVRTALVAANFDIAQGLECQPPALSLMADAGDGLATARTGFGAAACNNPFTATPRSEANPDAADPVRQITRHTRNCLTIANRGQADVRASIRSLTELESVYGSDKRDIRRAVADLQRGSPGAVYAAIGALFVDLLILFIGFFAAHAASSAGNQNTADMTPDDVISILRGIVLNHSEDGTVQTGFKQFLRHIEPRSLPHRIGAPTERDRHEAMFRNTLKIPDTDDPDITLVFAVLTSIPGQFQDEVDFTPIQKPGQSAANTGTEDRRPAIHDEIISRMNQAAASNGTAPNARPGTGTAGFNPMQNAQSAYRRNRGRKTNGKVPSSFNALLKRSRQAGNEEMATKEPSAPEVNNPPRQSTRSETSATPDVLDDLPKPGSEYH